MAERLLEVSNLVKHFPVGRRRTVKAINDVSFHIDRGETLALVGESGSGKTTVGRCILRLIEPTEGRITFDGAQVDTMSADQLRALRPRVQMVFQEPYDSLNPRMRIRKIVEEPILLGSDMTPAQRHDRVAEVLEMVRLGADSMDKYPHQFSAGEQQRIGIARAIATQPELVVLDEPTSALDVSVRAEILDLLTDLQEDLALSYLLISHDLTACAASATAWRSCISARSWSAAIRTTCSSNPCTRTAGRCSPRCCTPIPASSFRASCSAAKFRDRPAAGVPPPRPLPWAVDDCNDAYPDAEELLPGRQVACFRAREMNALNGGCGRRTAPAPLRHEWFQTLTGGSGLRLLELAHGLSSTSSPPRRAPSWMRWADRRRSSGRLADGRSMDCAVL